MSLIGIETKKHEEGVLTLTTFPPNQNFDYATCKMWRKILEHTGKKQTEETIKIALVGPEKIDDFWFNFSPVLIEIITIQDINSEPIYGFDVIIFYNKYENSDDIVSERIKEIVENGIGILTIASCMSGNINILSKISNISVTSTNPINTQMYWTEIGKNSDIFSPGVNANIMVEIKDNLMTEWEILASNIKTNYQIIENAQESIGGSGFSGESIFIASAYISMSNGIVILEETQNSSSSSDSTSSSSSSISDSSSSSSQIEYFDISESTIAHWKMNDSDGTNLVRDGISFLNLGNYYSGSEPIATSSVSEYGVINRRMRFNGVNSYIRTVSGGHLRLNSGTNIEDFSINFWITPFSMHNGIVLSKKDVWEIWITNDGKLKMLLFDNALNYKQIITANTVFSSESTYNVVINGSSSSMVVYINTGIVSIISSNIGFTGVNTKYSELFIGKNGSGNYFHGALDNIIILNRFLTNVEIEGIYKEGNGSETLDGTFYFISSSSSTSSDSSQS